MKEVQEHPHHTKGSLEAAIVQVMSDINKEQLIRACKLFQSRIELDSDGGDGSIE